MPSGNDLEVATKLAQESPKPLDRLPYTEEFERMYLKFIAKTHPGRSRGDFFQCLIGARKRGLVGRKHRPPATSKG